MLPRDVALRVRINGLWREYIPLDTEEVAYAPDFLTGIIKFLRYTPSGEMG